MKTCIKSGGTWVNYNTPFNMTELELEYNNGREVKIVHLVEQFGNTVSDDWFEIAVIPDGYDASDLNSSIEKTPIIFHGEIVRREYHENMLILYCEEILKNLPDNSVDLIFTSPPFFDTERYIGGNQPWLYKSRSEWVNNFVAPFIDHINTKFILYLDHKTKDDFEQYRKFDKIVPVQNKRHVRHRRPTTELLCYYK